MTATLNDVTSSKKTSAPSSEETAAAQLVKLAKERDLSLTGPDGLLKQFTKNVLETALNEEMIEHLGHERAEPERQSARVPIFVTAPGRMENSVSWYGRSGDVVCDLGTSWTPGLPTGSGVVFLDSCLIWGFRVSGGGLGTR